MKNKVNKVRGKTISRALFDESKEYFKKYVNDNTRKRYTENYRKYINFCRREFNCKTKEECATHIQEYSDFLKSKGYTPSTVHTYLAPVCIYHKTKMNRILKEKRHTSHYTRGRPGNNRLKRNDNNLENPLYEKTVKFQSAVGIRRSELQRLKGKDFQKDESGNWCVNVDRGKGGKSQKQIILPQDIDFVKSFFEGKDKNERIFSQDELTNKLPYHYLRAKHAQECYEYYLNMISSPEGEKALTEQIKARFKAPDSKGRIKHKPFKSQMVKGEYILRGENKKFAIENNLPIKYSKLALLAVSVFHLSHWRNDVTVASYMLVV